VVGEKGWTDALTMTHFIAVILPKYSGIKFQHFYSHIYVHLVKSGARASGGLGAITHSFKNPGNKYLLMHLL
jgi:hypothetical protein